MNIDISTESAEFISKLIETIDGQDNRATAAPYFYVIEERHVQPVPGGMGSAVHYYDSNQCESYDSAGELLDIYNEEVHRFDHIDDLLHSCPHVRAYDAAVEWRCKDAGNVFFTMAAYEQHIRENGHNLTQPRSYVKHAFRNAEMDNLFQALREIAGAIKDRP